MNCEDQEIERRKEGPIQETSHIQCKRTRWQPTKPTQSFHKLSQRTNSKPDFVQLIPVVSVPIDNNLLHGPFYRDDRNEFSHQSNSTTLANGDFDRLIIPFANHPMTERSEGRNDHVHTESSEKERW